MMASPMNARSALVAALLALGCGSPYATSDASADRAPSDAAAAKARAKDANKVEHVASPPSFVAAPQQGEITEVVRGAVADAETSGQRVVVYVGAEWCEPCTRFHKAVEAGGLDEQLAGVRFLEFDADRDQARLKAGGYSGRLIPRFAFPGDDGRFGGSKIEGGVKGEGAVDNIMKRLEPLLAANR